MKNQIIYFISGFVLCFLLMKRCNRTETITLPEKVTEYVTYEKIKEIPIETPIEVQKWYIDKKTAQELKEVKTELAEREKRIKNYESEYEIILNDFNHSDSVQKAQLFENATKLSQFSETWEDDLSILTVQGIVQGKVKEITPFLKLKERSVVIPLKEKNYRINAGIGADFNATTPVLKIGIGYNKVNIDYLKINSQNYGVVSYEIKF